MSGETKHVQELALKLPIIEKARLVDRLLASIDQPDSATDKLWKKEVEGRIEAYKAGKMKSVSLGKVLAKYGKNI
ncbi:MAG: addiction module protein [Candidatus Sumerlaeota bacterium]|nr:addiction module protein [Candidatus Sumerlaeota bacterium]